MTRIPSLDGLRAISIALVLLGHLNGTRGFGTHPGLHFANLGVRVFFVISGFLITTLLLGELRRSGRVDLKAFYLRRFFRIVPAFLAYMAVIGAATGLGLIAVSGRDALAALTYTVNYFADRSWYVGHLWSLSVEEQFYLLWPAIVAFAGARRGLTAAAFVMVAAPCVRLAWGHFAPSHARLVGEAFPTIADAIAIGCLLAGFRERLDRHAGYLRFLASPWFVLVPVLAFAVDSMSGHARLFWGIGETVLDVAIALVVDRCVRHPNGAFGKVLNARPIAFVGTLSYSLYLWQQPFLQRGSSGWAASFPVNVALSFAAALLCHYLVEKPCLSLRGRLRARPSSVASQQPA